MVGLASYHAYRYSRAVELCMTIVCVATHSKKKCGTKSKNIFSEMMKDVGVKVPSNIETRCSMKAKAGDDSMQQLFHNGDYAEDDIIILYSGTSLI